MEVTTISRSGTDIVTITSTSYSMIGPSNTPGADGADGANGSDGGSSSSDIGAIVGGVVGGVVGLAVIGKL